MAVALCYMPLCCGMGTFILVWKHASKAASPLDIIDVVQLCGQGVAC
jgi:hypothetical protein